MTAKAGASSDTLGRWDAIPWQTVEQSVRRLQARIVKAVEENRWNKVKSLQRLLTRSRSAKLLAVRRVTENKGKNTPGVDGATWTIPSQKLRGASGLRPRGYRPLPLRRIYIPKPNGKLRPLGIPTIRDRAMQALYLLALDPVAETQADGCSYGFRPMRSCADAIERCFVNLSRKSSPAWVMEGDIKGCFDNISHQWIMRHAHMERRVLEGWLKAGFLDNQVFNPTVAGTPQGGIISPVIANLALDGLEKDLRREFPRKGPGSYSGRAAKVHLIRYADDFIITASNEEILRDRVLPIVENFMSGRGLELSKEKTRFTHITSGFDFLGQNIRRYSNGKLLIKPAKKSIKSIIDKVKKIVREMWAATAGALIARLNPVIRGWANYHRHVVSKRGFTYLDNEIFNIIWRWAKSRHRRKGARWIKRKYFTRLGFRDWCFTGYRVGATTGKPSAFHLFHAQSVKITRHRLVASALNPYDPAWTSYVSTRKRRLPPAAASLMMALVKA
ncbi:group II intron reverse transcriptase/maturase [Halomonas sp. TRM85114]|uniref:group II intron reverse transcriptase/maturase n=1 Tax=Halomonas jincaotanensis TaxID=2810616 RepID=UPI001BD6395C|nr:group II intron reverse transcriptase/maturase [Halomonas jincaotanensis]MBS9405695.1 group II intron reverse transcriptase/maturase [Halomonas jincaotanensis]